MIGDLLKQLPAALGRYVLYHGGRLLGVDKSPDSATAANSSAIADGSVVLDKSYIRTVSWPTYRGDSVPPALSSDPLFQIWVKTSGGQKWSQYFAVYREVLGHLAASPLRILEIGVYRGASLDLWKGYFKHPETVIVGVDIEPSCARFDSPEAGKRVRIGNQADPRFLEAVVEEFGPFDLIIDDGSHRSGDQIASFNFLFSFGLKDPGIYLVEDLHASYWAAWRNSEYTFLDLCKALVEQLHAHYKRAGPDKLFVTRPSDHPMVAIDVPRITTMIREIRFFDSIVAIYKAQGEHAPFNIRMDNQEGAEWAAGRFP
jgi:hypothetical protein